MARGSYHNGFAPRDGQSRFPELWRGCIGAWAPCLGPSGLVLRDWSGFGRHGTLTTMDAASDWVIDSGRYALDFDGTNDTVDCGSGFSGANVSVSLWANAAASTAFMTAFGNSSGGLTVDGSITIGLNAASAWRIATENGTGFVTITSTGPVVGSWEHFVWTAQGSSMQFWRNAVSVGVATNTLTANWMPFATYLGSMENGSRWWNGKVDDVRIYNRILSANEIRLLSRRRGIAYEMEPPRRNSEQAAAAAARARLLTLLGVGR